ncbi:GLPGLI family protein [Mucilaginibacter sp. FT3.2]|uniref:GLPGLI family protein n=1 Tax=Mucilaginibacter sp. FT3.2 TaxID=2723090 RepID=UPI0016165F29|nr:GLPGLI family protein [Mucilaginibacter sp. FT3.2]MBB6232850.1 GLPGLI family protein [Mucilaginibacter sp. FT3.2]
MKNLIILTTCILAFGSSAVLAQNKHFTINGSIEFEKTVNMHAFFEKQINKNNEDFLRPAFDSYKKTQPQFKKLKSTLTFANNKTLYTPIESDAPDNGFFGDSPIVNQVNTIADDLTTGLSTNQKKVFEQTFLVKDTLRKINWKITSETREIAGFTCRRANALVMDSIYVVAFYTDDIAVSGGPESFTGLPGMILGLALPHENVTWFATKVNEIAIDDKSLVPPKKGKVVNNQQLAATLKNVMKDWGTYADAYLKAFSL